MAIQRQDGWANDSAKSDIDLTGMERRFVVRTSTGVTLASAAGPVSGVLQEGKIAGLYSSYATAGHPLKVIAGGAITIGQGVMAGASGTVVAGTTNQVGVARNACFSGEMCEVMVDRVS